MATFQAKLPCVRSHIWQRRSFCIVASSALCWILARWECFLMNGSLSLRRSCAPAALAVGVSDSAVPFDEEVAEEDIDTQDLPVLRRSALKLKRVEKPETVDIDAVTALVREELGTTVFQASPEEAGDELGLQSAAAMLQQWALKKEKPDIRREVLVEAIETALINDVPAPETLTSIMWSCGRLKVDHISSLLVHLRDRLPQVVHQMNAQNLTTFWCSAAKIQEFAEEVDDMIPNLIDAVLEKARDLQPKQISAFVWASGKLDLHPTEVQQIRDNIPGLLSEHDMLQLASKDLANFAFGLAQLDFRDAGVLGKIAKTTIATAKNCKVKTALADLPMIVVSLTRLGYKDVEMSKLLDAVADRLQRPRMLKKMPDWSLAALFWSWPKDGSMQGVRDMQGLLAAEVDKRIGKKLFNVRMLERSWMGPSEWKETRANRKKAA
ncbi:unnamed protein product [Durusdinium trenchii]|uniref:Uncharacterized protein n=1 Tax=Durusdinium trenchii TaxID=1381693 RepID=A0ABP0T1N9_9DINO